MELTSNATIVLYLLIFITATFFACKSQKKMKINNDYVANPNIFYFRKVPFLLSFLILWIFIFFSKSGPDYESYYLIISRLSWNNYSVFYDLEPVFNIVLLVLNGLVKGNIALTIALVKTITLVIVFLSLYIMRNRINIGLSIFCYVIWCYLESFYLLPMLFAASLIILASAIMRVYDKWFIPFLLVVLAAQIHNSAYLIVIVFFAALFLGNVSKISNIKRIVLVIGYITAIALSGTIFNYAVNFFSNFHYGGYQGGVQMNSGLLWIVMYVPLFVICYVIFQYESDQKLANLFFLFTITSAMFKYLSYYFAVIGRVELLLIPLYVIFLSEIEHKNPKIHLGKLRTTIFGVFVVAYIIFRGYLYFVSELDWMGIYYWINPFIQ